MKFIFELEMLEKLNLISVPFLVICDSNVKDPKESIINSFKEEDIRVAVSEFELSQSFNFHTIIALYEFNGKEFINIDITDKSIIKDFYLLGTYNFFFVNQLVKL